MMIVPKILIPEEVNWMISQTEIDKHEDRNKTRDRLDL